MSRSPLTTITLGTLTMLRPTIVINDPRIHRHLSISVLYSYQHARCFYCDDYLRFVPYNQKNNVKNGYTIDHVIPNYLGFTMAGNKVLACRTCNHTKDNRLPTYEELRKAINLYDRMNRPFVCSLEYPEF